jgi:AcrR family transcriptional regulator
MPPRPKLTKGEIVDAVIKIIEENGSTQISARNIADELKCSTAPVYTMYSSMEEIQRDALIRSHEMLIESMKVPYTDREFLNMGIGIVVFARDHPNLYMFLYHEGSHFKSEQKNLSEIFKEIMITDSRFTDMPESLRDELLHTMWTYTHGLASFGTEEMIQDFSNEAIINELGRVGMIVISYYMKLWNKGVE